MIPALPEEILAMVAEHAEKRSDQLNLRLASKALSYGAAKPLFANLSKRLTAKAFEDIQVMSITSLKNDVTSLNFKVTPVGEDDWVTDFIKCGVTPEMVVTALRSFPLRRMMCKFDTTAGWYRSSVTRALVRSVADIFEGVPASVSFRELEFVISDHCNYDMARSTWNKTGNTNFRAYRKFLKRFTSIKMEWSVCRCYAPITMALPSDIVGCANLEILDLSATTSWIALQESFSQLAFSLASAAPAAVYSFPVLRHLRLKGVTCTASELRDFVQSGQNTLATIDLELFILGGAWDVPNNWATVFEFLATCPNLVKFSYAHLGTNRGPSDHLNHVPHRYLKDSRKGAEWKKLEEGKKGLLDADYSASVALGRLLGTIKVHRRMSGLPDVLDTIDEAYCHRALYARPRRAAADRARSNMKAKGSHV